MSPSSYPGRGEVYWMELNSGVGAEMQKIRPCLIVTSNFVNRRRRTVAIVPISQTSSKGFPLYVPLASVSATSQAVIDQIRVVDKERIGQWIGTVTGKEMDEVGHAMKLVLGLD